MKYIKKVAAGIIPGRPSALPRSLRPLSPPLADPGSSEVVSDAPSHMNIPPSGYEGSAKAPHVLVTAVDRPERRIARLVNAGSAGSVHHATRALRGWHQLLTALLLWFPS